MKVLYLCADLGIPVLGDKGAAVHVRAMVRALAAAGHQVSLVAATLTKSAWRPPHDLPRGVGVHHVPASRDMTWATGQLRAFADGIGASRGAASEVRRVLYNQELRAALDRTFDADPPDVVYERASLLSTAGLAFARGARVPHVLELNAPLADEQRRFRQGGALQELADASEGWLLRGTQAVLAVSAPLADYVTSLGVESARVHVVPNGIDPEAFAPGPPDVDLRARVGVGSGPILGFVGGLRPWHGVEQIPALVAALRPEFPDVTALVVGDGPLRARLERDAEGLGVAAAVRLVGTVGHEAVPPLVRQFDVALAPYPPSTEAFYFSPLKVFEYMACGVPVVASAQGQLADVIDDGRTGLLYPADRFDALVDACRHLLRSADLRRRMGDAGRARVVSTFTWARNAARVTDIASTVNRAVCA